MKKVVFCDVGHGFTGQGYSLSVTFVVFGEAVEIAAVESDVGVTRTQRLFGSIGLCEFAMTDRQFGTVIGDNGGSSAIDKVTSLHASA